MTRINLTDGSPRWFDDERAVRFNDRTTFDGRNQIHNTTGSQWSAEVLYYTASGRWILHWWSAYDRANPTYEEISEATALDWLIAQDRHDDDDLPTAVREALATRSAELEI